MTEIVTLRQGEAPPSTEPSVMVGPSSVEPTSAIVHASTWTFFNYDPNVPGAREATIAEAKSYAERHGIKRIYVQGGGDIAGNG